MASWQSKILSPVLRLQVKRKLVKAKDAAGVRKVFGAAPPPPRGATFSANVVGGIAGEWAKSGGVAAGTMLYLHGGGYLGGSTKTHRAITAAFANRGLDVFAADYRLAPENVFPAAVDDGLAAYKGLLTAGVAPAKLTIAGDSAGGGLTLATLLAAKAEGLPMPACAIVFSPWTDLAITGDTVRTNLKRDPMLAGNLLQDGAAFYLNGADAKNPLASPLYGDLTGLPPLFVQVGDTEVLLNDSTRFAARAQESGVAVDLKIWEGMPHVWQIFQLFLPEARAAVDDAAGFAKAHFSH
jgi:monoterpene epsilon-lactone hydrolase